MKRLSTSLLMREMEIKTTMLRHFTPTKIAIIKENEKKKTRVDKDVEKLKPFCSAVGMKKVQMLWKSLVVFQKVKQNYPKSQQFHL